MSVTPSLDPAPSAQRAVLAAADGDGLLSTIRNTAASLGFGHIGVAGVDLHNAEPGLQAWLEQGFHGGMHYMQAHGLKRARPAELVPGTLRVITARMDYLPAATPADWRERALQRLQQPGEAVISLYARGRDYHKVMRARLQQLADFIEQSVGPIGYRVFSDSAPVLEVELASRSAQGWRGKHTLLLNREAGSTFFLGEIFTDVPLPLTQPAPGAGHCGQCTACITACPWAAPQWNAQTGKVDKCDLCRDRIDQGLKPACVTTCAMSCLQFTTPDTASQEKRQGFAEQIQRSRPVGL